MMSNKGNKHPLAGWSTEQAIEVVKEFYSAGATRVDVVVTAVEKNYANELEVTFPKKGREKLLGLLRSLEPEKFEMMRGQGIEDPYADDGSFAGQAVTLSWD